MLDDSAPVVIGRPRAKAGDSPTCAVGHGTPVRAISPARVSAIALEEVTEFIDLATYAVHQHSPLSTRIGRLPAASHTSMKPAQCYQNASASQDGPGLKIELRSALGQQTGDILAGL